MKMTYIDEDSAERLRVAIIAQAGKDYLLYKEREYNLNKLFEACKMELEDYEEKLRKNRNDILQVVTFFKSKWFQTLSEGETNYDRITQRLDEQHVILMKEKEERKRKEEERKRKAEEKKRLKQST